MRLLPDDFAREDPSSDVETEGFANHYALRMKHPQRGIKIAHAVDVLLRELADHGRQEVAENPQVERVQKVFPECVHAEASDGLPRRQRFLLLFCPQDVGGVRHLRYSPRRSELAVTIM